MAPTPFARAENAPARTNIQIMYKMLVLDAPFEKISIRSFMGMRGRVASAHMAATTKAMLKGMA